MRLVGGRAPAARIPMAHFLFIPPWLLVAAWLFASSGEALQASRWAPASLAQVHVLLLGVLGNGMLGSLQQFLPVAAGADTRWLQRMGPVLCLLFNLGLALLLAGFLVDPAWRGWGGALLATALLPFAAVALHALWQAGLSDTPRWQLAVALSCLGSAGALGLWLAASVRGLPGLSNAQTVDLHAVLGLGAGVIGLIAAVGALVLPMFQGLARWSERGQRRAWLAAAIVLLAALVLRLAGELGSLELALLSALPALWLGGCVLYGQWRRSSRRRPGLVRAWRIGWLLLCSAVLLALLGYLADHPAAVTAAAWLLLAAALPLLLQGMLLEIVPFLHWNRLVLARPPGSHAHLPGVDALLPERDKQALLPLNLLFALMLVVTVWIDDPLAWMSTGALLATQSLALLGVIIGCQQRSRSVAREFGLAGA